MKIPYHGPPILGAQDEDNFVRNLLTILPLVPGDPPPGGSTPPPPRPPAGLREDEPGSVYGTARYGEANYSALSISPVVTLSQIKLHCHIDQSDSDTLLVDMEIAAHLYTEDVLRLSFDFTCGANIKQAMLMLIAHWYRNREAILTGTIQSVVPLGYYALLSPQRSYLGAY